MTHSTELHDLVRTAEEQTDEFSTLDRLLALCLTVLQQSRTIVRNTVEKGEPVDKPAVSDAQITFGPRAFHTSASEQAPPKAAPAVHVLVRCLQRSRHDQEVGAGTGPMYEMRQPPMARQPYQGPSPCRLEPRSDLTPACKRRRFPEPPAPGSPPTIVGRHLL